MTYKNVVFLVLDSLSYRDFDYLKSNFDIIDLYKDNSIVFNNIFSQAPYTEAALTSLLTSNNILDDKGYLFNLKYKKNNINEVFKSKGYKTFNGLWYYPNILSFKRGLDDFYYCFSLSYSALYEYRIKYYIDLYKNDKLLDVHLKNLYELFEDFFEDMLEYVDDYQLKPGRFEYLKRYSNIEEHNFEEYKDIITKERSAYYKDKEKYIYEILEEKRIDLHNIKHIVFCESNGFKEKKKSYYNEILRESIKQLFSTLFRGTKNNSINVLMKSTYKNIRERKFKNIKYSIMNILNYTGKPSYEFGSVKSNLDYIIEYLEKNKNEKNFIYYQAMDTHFPFNFYSLDIDDIELIEKEHSDFKGNRDKKSTNRFYEASIRYTNEKIKEFILALKNKGIYEDTLLVLTSDHGSSYIGDYFRDKKVCTMYDENYKVPLILIGENIEGEVSNNYGSSIDIIPTIIDIIDDEFESEFKFDGISLKRDEHEFITFEYMGSGCPDYNIKIREIAVRSRKYKVIADVFTDFSYKIVAVYDILKDPKELHNIKDSKEVNVLEHIKILEKRVERMRLR